MLDSRTSVVAFLDHEDVGVVVLSHLDQTWMQWQTRERCRAAWAHVRVNTRPGPTPFAILHSISASMHSPYSAPYQMQKRALLGEDRFLRHTRCRAACPQEGPRLMLISLRPMAVGDHLDQHHVVSHTDPKRTGHAGAIDDMPHNLDQSSQEKALDAL